VWNIQRLVMLSRIVLKDSMSSTTKDEDGCLPQWQTLWTSLANTSRLFISMTIFQDHTLLTRYNKILIRKRTGKCSFKFAIERYKCIVTYSTLRIIITFLYREISAFIKRFLYTLIMKLYKMYFHILLARQFLTFLSYNLLIRLLIEIYYVFIFNAFFNNYRHYFLLDPFLALELSYLCWWEHLLQHLKLVNGQVLDIILYPL
jgi:hypothetical protein